MPGGPRYRAVLLDFRGILVGFRDTEWWVRRACAALGREIDTEGVFKIERRLEQTRNLPGFDEDELRVDTSVETNREVTLRRFREVGLDDDLASALHALDFDPDAWPVYPDAAGIVNEIKALGCSTALVSDFHVDLRPHLEANGIVLDAYVISYEHGFQKPDPRMFTTALEALGTEPGESLMVGDRASHDGGAADVGIDTLILPAPAEFGARGLDVVLSLLR
jgi:HAD superfamily hydrolase (TIGR01509 family)